MNSIRERILGDDGFVDVDRPKEEDKDQVIAALKARNKELSRQLTHINEHWEKSHSKEINDLTEENNRHKRLSLQTKAQLAKLNDEIERLKDNEAGLREKRDRDVERLEARLREKESIIKNLKKEITASKNASTEKKVKDAEPV